MSMCDDKVRPTCYVKKTLVSHQC